MVFRFWTRAYPLHGRGPGLRGRCPQVQVCISCRDIDVVEFPVEMVLGMRTYENKTRSRQQEGLGRVGMKIPLEEQVRCEDSVPGWLELLPKDGACEP